jgi:lipoate-protein ligase B
MHGRTDTRTLETLDLGRCAYAPAMALQQRLVGQVRRDPSRAVLLTVEHDPPVITLGRRGRAEDILASREHLSAGGVEVHQTRRGGEVTWHGPGQLVAYFICRLDRTRPAGGGAERLTLRGFVRRLEEAVIRLLADCGLAAGRREGYPGVWVGGRKVAAVGVAVERWVTYHGLALNVRPDLSSFESIVPCGLNAGQMTSMERLGRPERIDDVRPRLVNAVCEAFGFAGAVPVERIRQGAVSAT